MGRCATYLGGVLLPLFLILLTACKSKGINYYPSEEELLDAYINKVILFKEGLQGCEELLGGSSLIRFGDAEFRLTDAQVRALCRSYEKDKRIKPAKIRKSLLNEKGDHKLYSIELHYTGYTYSVQLILKNTPKGWLIVLR